MQEQLNLEDKRKLQMFVNQADRLSFCKFFETNKSGMALALGDELTEAIVPERQEFIEMLTILRPFLMQDEEINIGKIVSRVRQCARQDEQVLNRLNSINDKFKFYKGDYDNKAIKYRNKYFHYISPYPDVTCDLGQRTVFNILNSIMNGYYFHSDLEKQTEIASFVKEQANRWLGSQSEDDLTEKDLTVTRERVREAFKFRFYGLTTDIAGCVLELKNLIEELFTLPLDEELHQKSQILYEFLSL
ncbi:hypothetical protein H6F95_18705 [Cyanobacteria bacterium FACHB-471]|nr:hypothetical protein [Cyanobacteria bacterium FACHB-471]